MSTFLYRSQAVEAARHFDYVGFRTTKNTHDMWRLNYEPGGSPAADFAHTHDFVHHAEITWIGPEDQRERVGVIVVNITLEELREEGYTTSIDGDEVWLEGPGFKYLVEPITTDLWETVGSKTPATRTPRTVSEPKPPGAQRERSVIESPVKVVWRVAEEMTGATRSAVITECVNLGVNKSTAATQYYRWQKSKGQ